MKKIFFTLTLLSIALMSCEPTAKTPAPPTGLGVFDVTDASAVLKWGGDASIYEISIGDVYTKTITTNTYKATALTANTNYTWKVRAKADGVYSNWIDGPTFTTNPAGAVTPREPVDLTVTDITATSAVISWVGSAESYEIEVGGVIENVNTTTFAASDLLPETTYSCKVRAKNGDLYSNWVYCEPFTTPILIPEHLDFTYPFLFNYFGNYFGPNTSNFTIVLTTMDPYGSNKTGWLISMDICSTQADESGEYPVIPEGTYKFSNTAAAGNIVIGVNTNSTFMNKVTANGTLLPLPGIVSGNVNISGNRDNYAVTMDIILDEGSELSATYNGPIPKITE